MSDLQAMYIFLRKSVSPDMIQFLVSTTNSVIAIPENYYPSPPNSPIDENYQSQKSIPDLYKFIEKLIIYTHVQTSTLMSTLVYLTRLRSILPPNSTGMETTRHRIFLGCLILAAKNLNDTSPMNKHWAKYTDGLLTLHDVNVLEMELIDYLGWDNLRITDKDLISNFGYFLTDIKAKLRLKHDIKLQQQQQQQISSYRSESYITTKNSHLPSPPLYSSASNSQRSLTKPQVSISTSSVPSLISSNSTTSIVSNSETIGSIPDIPRRSYNDPLPSKPVLKPVLKPVTLNEVNSNTKNQKHIYSQNQIQHHTSNIDTEFKPKPLRLLNLEKLSLKENNNTNTNNIYTDASVSSYADGTGTAHLRVVNSGYY